MEGPQMGVSANFDEPSALIRNDGALRLQRGSANQSIEPMGRGFAARDDRP